jgi:hypothetical protein
MNPGRMLMAGVGVAFLVAGCGGGRRNSKVDFSKMGPSMNAKRYANLEKLAAEDLRCTEELAPTYLGENQYRMSGCNADTTFELRCRMGQCAWVPDVRGRASFDLQCDKEQLTSTKLDPVTVGVSGCGKRASYRLLGTRSYTWTLNSPVSAESQEVPTAAPSEE